MHDQRSVWELTDLDLEKNNNDLYRSIWKKRIYAHCSRCFCCCSKSLLYGLIVGGLASGTALAITLTLYLYKPGTNIVTVTTTGTTTSTTTSAGTFNINLVTNGNAETGNCSISNEISSPTGWSVSGPISQVYYNGTFFVDQSFTSPGPNDRDQCYFMGHQSASTSMWQTINLTNQVDSTLIDNQIVKFNLSAWIGGIGTQDDNVDIKLTFLDQNNRTVGNDTRIGPIFANDRSNQSKLLPQQTNGLVPIGARSTTLLVTITRVVRLRNDGDVDNIGLYLYQ